MAVTVHIASSELQKALKNIEKYSQAVRDAAYKEMVSTAYMIDAKQKQNINNLSSKGKNYSGMRNANQVNVNTIEKSVTVSNDHKASEFFEYGTKPHEIRVKNKQVLATLGEYNKSGKGFTSIDKKGNTWSIFGKKVNHPGTSPKPFFFKAVEAVKDGYIERMKKILSNAK